MGYNLRMFSWQNVTEDGMSHSMFKTDEIKTLRISSYLNFVCNRAGIELTGYQFERYFEPEKVIRDEATKAVKRSCKYDRYIYKSVCCVHLLTPIKWIKI